MTQAHQIGPGQTSDTVVTSLRGGDSESHDSDTPLVISQFEFEPAMYQLGNATLSLKLVAIAGNGAAGLTTHVQIYNISDHEWVGSGLDFTLQAPTKLEETLTIGSGAGEIKEASKLYEFRIWVDSPADPEDTIELGSAELRIINTIS